MGPYSFNDVFANLNGPAVSIDLGYGAAVDKEGITILMDGDKNTRRMGADGQGMHSLHASRAGDVIVRLLKTSVTNSKLMAAYDKQSQDTALWGQNVITVEQKRFGDLTIASQCAFQKKPDIAYKEDGDFYEWRFQALSVDTILGSGT